MSKQHQLDASLPQLTQDQVEALVNYIRKTADFDSLHWDSFCCASDGVDGGFDLAIATLEIAYGLREPDEDDEDEDNEDEE